jgi:hypothetical protein
MKSMDAFPSEPATACIADDRNDTLNFELSIKNSVPARSIRATTPWIAKAGGDAHVQA